MVLRNGTDAALLEDQREILLDEGLEDLGERAKARTKSEPAYSRS